MIWTLNTVTKLQLRHQNQDENNRDYEQLYTMYATANASHSENSVEEGLSEIVLTEGSAF